MGYSNRKAVNEHYVPRTRTGELSHLPPSHFADFVNKYYPRKSAEWVPDHMAGIGKSRFDLGELNVIYRTTTGVMPNYRGHVPGVIFSCGVRFGADTIDAKRWLKLHKD